MRTIDKILLLFCFSTMLLIPFTVMEEIHIIWLVVIGGVCVSWGGYMLFSKGIATFGLVPEDKGSAWESIAWMALVSTSGVIMILLSILLIKNATNVLDVVISTGAIIASTRIMIPCVSFGRAGIRVLKRNRYNESNI